VRSERGEGERQLCAHGGGAGGGEAEEEGEEGVAQRGDGAGGELVKVALDLRGGVCLTAV
jgi:hypothetical protein